MPAPDADIRPGEVTTTPPSVPDAGVFFIGTIRTPWKTRSECPRRGTPDGSVPIVIRLGSRVTTSDSPVTRRC